MEAEVDFKIISTPEFTHAAQKIWPQKPIAAICREVAKSFYLATPLGKGLYKLRMATGQKGKRGGARIIFLCITKQQEILLLTAFTKARIENLSKSQLSELETLGKNVLTKGDWKYGQGDFRVIETRIETGGRLQDKQVKSSLLQRKDKDS